MPPYRIIPVLVLFLVLAFRSFASVPENDRFEDRESLTGAEVSFEATVVEATREDGEPIATGAAGRTVWWTWTPPSDGVLQVSGTGLLAIFTGDTLGSLTRMGSLFLNQRPVTNDPTVVVLQSGSFSLASALEVRGGVPLQLQLDGTACDFRTNRSVIPGNPLSPPITFPPWNPGLPCTPTSSLGTNLSIEIRLVPYASDTFAGRQGPSIPPALFLSRNRTATTEIGEPVNPIGDGRTLWWTWTSPRKARYGVQFLNGQFQFEVFRGLPLDGLARIPDVAFVISPVVIRVGSDLPSMPSFGMEAGESVSLRIDSIPGATLTNDLLAFRLDELPKPVNDDRADASSITNTGPTQSAIASANLAGATTESGEDPTNERTVWWTWTAPASGEWTLQLVGDAIFFARSGPTIRVLRNDGRDGLSTLATREGDSYAVRFSAQAGQPLWIVAEMPIHLGISSTSFRLNRTPENHHPEGAEPLRTGEEFRIALSGAEVLEPGSFGRLRRIWYRWRSPSDGFLALEGPIDEAPQFEVWIRSPDGEPVFAPGASNSIGALLPDPTWQQVFQVTKDIEYLVSVTAPDRGNLSLRADFTDWRLESPQHLSVAPDGTTRLTASIFNGSTQDGARIVGFQIQLSDEVGALASGWTQVPDPEDPGRFQMTRPVLEPGHWHLTPILTNGFGRILVLPRVSVRLPPSNDSFAHAQEIPSIPWTGPASTYLGSGLEPGEPGELNQQGTNSIWFGWQPTFDGPVVFDPRGVSFSAFTGDTVANLNRIAGPSEAPLTLEAKAGIRIHFRLVADVSRMVFPPLPPRITLPAPADGFADRIRLPAEGGHFQVPAGMATFELEEVPPEPWRNLGSLGWSWTPTEDGTVFLNSPVWYTTSNWRTFRNSTVAGWRLFRGSRMGDLQSLPSTGIDFGSETLAIEAFLVRGGEAVNIAGYPANGGDAWLEFLPNPPREAIGPPRIGYPGHQIYLPVSTSPREAIRIEHSRDLSSWSTEYQETVLEGGMRWLGPFQSEGFYRLVRESGVGTTPGTRP
jgi:hypothetical protein